MPNALVSSTLLQNRPQLLRPFMNTKIEGQPFRTLVDSPKLTLTSTQILALHATPIDLLAAPGTGLFIDLESIIVTKPAGTAYAAVAAGDDLQIRETDGSGTILATLETIGFLDQATAQTRVIRPFRIVAASTTSDITRLTNTSIALFLGGAITTGDSPLYFQAYYWVRPLPIT